MPILSVILPTFNRACMLRQAVESVCAQTFQDWELVVVDDGSTDQTPSIMQEFERLDPRIRYVPQQRGGVSKARNTGLQVGQGRYVAFLDDDDLFLPSALAILVKHLEARSQAGFVYGQAEIEGPNGKVFAIEPEQPVRTFCELFARSAIRIQTVLCRRELIERVGGFDERLTIGEDYDLWLRIAAIASFDFVAQPVVRYRIHTHNTCVDAIALHMQRDIVIKKVPVNRILGITPRMKQKRLAINAYRLSRLHRENANYLAAATSLCRAVWRDPLVGLAMTDPAPDGWKRLWFGLKPYLAVLVCGLQAVPYQRREAFLIVPPRSSEVGTTRNASANK